MRGVDVHGSKGPIDWNKVRSAGYEFAFLKATEGRTFDDERFAFNRRAAKAAGLKVGGYHFARPDNNSAEAEAAHFLRVCQPERGELLPVLDWEQNPPTATWALRFLKTVEAAIGARPIFYTYPDFLRRTGSFTELSRYPLWYAAYGPNDGQEHPARPPSQLTFAVHQFTSKGRVPGISGPVDLNVLKLSSINPLLYGREDDVPDWHGNLDFYASGRLVSVGVVRDREDRITPEALQWVREVRRGGGRGRVAPHPGNRERAAADEGGPETLVPIDEAAIFEAGLPENEEGGSSAGSWAEAENREQLEGEDFSAVGD